MKERYHIVEVYNGLFDSEHVIAATDDLFNAVHLVELLKKMEDENPCYSYDFKKVTDNLDDSLDWIPIDSFFGFGQVIDCKNYSEYLEKKFIKGGE